MDPNANPDKIGNNTYSTGAKGVRDGAQERWGFCHEKMEYFKDKEKFENIES